MKRFLLFFTLLIFESTAQSYLDNNWVLFNSENSELKSNFVTKTFEDNEGNYWFSLTDENSGGILQRYTNGVWTTFDSTNSPLTTAISITDIAQTNDGILIFGTGNNGLYTKDGEIWDNLNTDNSSLPDNFIFRVTVDRYNRYWLGIPNYGVGVYDNGNWIFYDYQNSFNGIADFNFIEVDSTNKVWIGTDYYGLYYFNGNSWVKAISGQFSGGPPRAVVGLSVDSQNEKWIAINERGGGSRIAKSLTDTSFLHYDSLDIGLPFTLFSYDALLIDNNNTKYFGTTDGLIIFNDVSWNKLDSLNSPIPANWFENGIVDSKNNKIFLLSSFYPPKQNYGVIYYSEDSVNVTSIKHQYRPASKFQLFQNFPNPFNAFTRIQYVIPTDGRTLIDVFDMLGNRIKTLLNEYLATGSYSISFDSENLSSGVYIYRVSHAKFSKSKKMILLK